MARNRLSRRKFAGRLMGVAGAGLAAQAAQAQRAKRGGERTEKAPVARSGEPLALDDFDMPRETEPAFTFQP